MLKLTNVRINLQPTSVIETSLGIQKNGPAHAYLTKLCKEEMDPFVPYGDTGLLADTAKNTTNKIIYSQPYAHYIYEGKVMGPNIPIIENGKLVGFWSKAPKYYTGADIVYNTDRHPLATSHWDKVMWTAKKTEIEKKVQDFISRGSKE